MQHGVCQGYFNLPKIIPKPQNPNFQIWIIFGKFKFVAPTGAAQTILTSQIDVVTWPCYLLSCSSFCFSSIPCLFSVSSCFCSCTSTCCALTEIWLFSSASSTYCSRSCSFLDFVLWWERSALIISGCSFTSFPFTYICNNRYGIQIWLTS